MNAHDDLTEDLSAFEDPIDAMVEEFVDRVRKGESPSIAEYEARHPELVDRVRKVLGAAAMMEQLGRSSQKSRFLPERFGEFRVLRELGSGGMGVVYEAVQESLWRHVAVKTLHHSSISPKRLQRFRREAQAVAQLHHTNIVPIFGVGEHEGLPYYVMQCIRGKGLDVFLQTWRRDRPAPDKDRWRFAVRVGIQAAEALEYAHNQGVLHRDIKPSNLLIDDDETVWITDFGLAKLVGGEDLTNSGDVIGTLRYLAPEALRGEFDRRGDVYSLGLTLYELVTLHSPFPEMTPSELLRQVTEGALKPPRQLVPSIPADLETIILKAIAHDPGHRYPTAAAMADDLKRFLEDRPIHARRVGPVERLWRWSRRNRSIATMAGAVAGSLVLAAVVGLAGYVLEARQRVKAEAANRKLEANVTLMFAAFEKLFERYGMDNQSLPPPPTIGMAGPRGPMHPDGDEGPRGPMGPDHGPDGHPPRRPPGPDRGPTGPDEGPPMGRFGPGPGPDRPGPGPDGPGRGPRPRDSQDDTTLLRSVLTFYDQFAEQNATNPKLQSDAAWAYRKVGDLYRRMEQTAEAEEAYEHAIGMFEKLTRQFPADREIRLRLVESYIMTDADAVAPEALDQVERRCLEAKQLVDGLVAESPEDLEILRAHVWVQAMLGSTAKRLDRFDEAMTRYRRAIDLASTLHERSPGDFRVQLDRLSFLETLAEIQVAKDLKDDARVSVAAILVDLRGLQAQAGLAMPLADRVRHLAEICEDLGDSKQAEEMNRWAVEIGSRSRHGGR